MTVIGIILLILAGILLFLLEFLVIPGVTIAGIGGLLFMGGAVYLAFDSMGFTAGIIVLVCVVATIIITLVIALRAKTWNKISLQSSIGSKAIEIDGQTIKAGDIGKAVTRLNPIGTVIINDAKFEGHSVGPFIDPNTPVEVVKVTSNHIVVKPKIDT